MIHKLHTHREISSKFVGMDSKKGSLLSSIPIVSSGIGSFSNTMTKSINLVSNAGTSTPSMSNSTISNMAALATSPPITINITNVTPLASSSDSTTTDSTKLNTGATILTYQPSNLTSSGATTTARPSSETSKGSGGTAILTYQPSSSSALSSPRPTSINISAVSAVSPGSSPVSSTSYTPVASPVLSHIHIPRGAAAVANMATTRTSIAVTAAHRSNIPNRGIQLNSSNWGRSSNTIITCGIAASNTTAPVITTTNTTLATTKFTRVPATQLSPRQGSMANTATSLSNVSSIVRPTSTSNVNSIIRPTSITRVTNATSLISPNSAGGILRNVPANNSVVVPRVATNNVTGNASNLSSVSRSSIVPTRTVRPPTLSSSILNPPIRLTQNTIGPQKTPNATSYALTSVHRPVLQGTSTGIRARATTNTPRFAANQSNTNPNNRGNFSSAVVSSSVLPSRPQSNPGLSSATRPVMCASRPASTGPASAAPLQTIRSTGVVRGFSSASQSGTFVRATEGGSMTVRPTMGSSLVQRQQPQQYLQMMNSNNIQKVSCLSSGGSGRGVTFNTSSVSPGSAAIAVRITSSPAGSQVANTLPPRNRTDHTGPNSTVVAGDGGSKGGGCAVASAAAAVLPPGTTITPAVLPPHHDTAQSVYLHRATDVVSNVTGGSLSGQQFYVDNKTPVSGNSALVRCGGGGARRNDITSGATPQSPAGSKPTASPRPSILRKRPDYDASVSKACKNLTGALSSSSSGGSSSSPPSPKRPDSGGGNSAASTGSATLSADSSPGLLIEESDINEEVRVPVAILPEGISPRKKPRKQQLTGNEMHDAQHTTDEEDDRRPPKRPRPVPVDIEEFESNRWHCDVSPLSQRHRSILSSPMRNHKNCSLKKNNRLMPRLFNPRNSKSKNYTFNTTSNSNLSVDSGNINNNDNINNGVVNNVNVNNVLAPLPNEPASNNAHNIASSEDSMEPPSPHRKRAKLCDDFSRMWLTRNNHFVRHTDVIVSSKDTTNKIPSLAGHSMPLHKLEGWKVVHVGDQVSELVDVEKEVSTRLNDILEHLESKSKSATKVVSKDMDQVCELIKANVQRSKIIQDQMLEAKMNMSKIFTHKDKVAQIMIKYGGKRQLRKKDKR